MYGAAIEQPQVENGQREISASVQAGKCPSCDGDLLIYVGLYLSWQECLNC